VHAARLRAEAPDFKEAQRECLLPCDWRGPDLSRTRESGNGPLRPVGGRGNVGLQSELTSGRASATSVSDPRQTCSGTSGRSLQQSPWRTAAPMLHRGHAEQPRLPSGTEINADTRHRLRRPVPDSQLRGRKPTRDLMPNARAAAAPVASWRRRQLSVSALTCSALRAIDLLAKPISFFLQPP
jgi:hypothetical protein